MIVGFVLWVVLCAGHSPAKCSVFPCAHASCVGMTRSRSWPGFTGLGLSARLALSRPEALPERWVTGRLAATGLVWGRSSTALGHEKGRLYAALVRPGV